MTEKAAASRANGGEGFKRVDAEAEKRQTAGSSLVGERAKAGKRGRVDVLIRKAECFT